MNAVLKLKYDAKCEQVQSNVFARITSHRDNIHIYSKTWLHQNTSSSHSVYNLEGHVQRAISNSKTMIVNGYDRIIVASKQNVGQY